MSSRQIILEQISKNDWESEHVEEKFIGSLLKSKHQEYLTIHPKHELFCMRLCKVKDQNIGFAITAEKEIISVHNSTGIPNLGTALVQKAVEL